jgi:DNA helicase-2/ATP-dependent DNA helicase PcrA
MSQINRILENLNEQQHQAVITTEGYVRVIAGAGSGKTKALTSRYAYLVEELGINASNILCVTPERKTPVKLDMSFIK